MLWDRSRLLRAILCITLAVLFVGCDKKDGSSNSSSAGTVADNSCVSESHPQFPDRPGMRTLAPGVEFCEIRVSGDGPGLPMALNLYLPTGQHAAKSLPC